MQHMNYQTVSAVDDFWIQKSRVNFLAYRQYLRHGSFLYNWFIIDLCRQFQQFYVDYRAGKRPVLLISVSPQHGKSWCATDFISWIAGLDPTLRIIYASYSDVLGKRCNNAQKRIMASPKYKKIFPGTNLSVTGRSALKTSTHLEYVDMNDLATGGQFRNTTINGSVTGESLDIGIIDDSVKGREQAESMVISNKIWDWYTNDFGTRFSDHAGLVVIMTRWTPHDLVGRILETGVEATVVNYPAIATDDETHRDTGDPLFPELKSLQFLEKQKKVMSERDFEALYQGAPTVKDGNIFKDSWWRYYDTLPPLQYKFITVDTAQKDKTQHDWTVFHCFGKGIDGNIYLLDRLRGKYTSPKLRKVAEKFYRKHDTPRRQVGDPLLRSMSIEDKSSGSGLIQELRALRLNVKEVPRPKDKVIRGCDAAVFIELGYVHLPAAPGIDTSNLTKEAREFPNSEFDDEIDTLMTAVEIEYINKRGAVLLPGAVN